MKQMFKIIAFLAVGLVGLWTAGCSSSDDPDNSGTEQVLNPNGKTRYEAPVLTPGEKATAEKINDLGLRLFSEAYKCYQHDQNLAISPWNTTTLLSVLLNGINKEESDSILSEIGIATLDDVNSYLKVMMKHLPTADARVLLSTPNSFWTDMGFSVNPEFEKILTENFGTEIRKTDFKSLQGPKEVNTWSKEISGGAFPQLLDEGMVHPFLFFQANFLHFRGEWAQPLDDELIYKDFFNANGQAKVVPMMVKTLEDIKVWEAADYDMAELKYGNGAYAMYLILPKEGKSPADILSSGSDMFKNIPDPEEREVYIKLPKFDLEERMLMSDAIKACGLGGLIKEKADYSRIGTSIDPDSYCNQKSEIMSQLKIKVDERGTEVKSIVYTDMVTGVLSETKDMVFDRPFISMIREATTGAIIFAGVINEL